MTNSHTQNVAPPLGGFVATLKLVLNWSVLVGGLAVGGIVSLLHLLLNEVSSGLVGTASLMWFFVLNFAFVGMVTGGAAIAVPVIRFVISRLPEAVGSPLDRWMFARGEDPALPVGVRFGLQCFAVIYAVFGVLYGLTYDQTILVHPQGWVGMVAYLVVGAGLITIVVWWASSVLLSWASRVGVARSATMVAVVIGLAHAGVVASNWTNRSEEPPLRSAAGVTVIQPSQGSHSGTESASDSEAGDSDADGSEPKSPPAEPVDGAGQFPAAHVVLLGFDGLDPVVIDRLIEQGELPNFARLRDQGVHAPVRTVPHANSAVIWSSIYSGHTPTDHGIHDFYRVQMPGLGRGLFPVHRSWFIEMANVLQRVGLARQIPVVRGDLQRFPIWEIVDHFGVSAGVIDGYLNSYPAVSLDSDDSYLVAYGADLFTQELEAGRMEIQDIGSFIQPVDLLLKEDYPNGEDFEWQSVLAFKLLKTRAQPRFLNLYWHQPDALQHNTWRELEPWRFPFTEAPERVAIVEQHRAFDSFLGRIDQAVAPGTVFMLVSDHGHSATIVHSMDTQHRHGPDGVLMIWGAGVEVGRALESPHVYDVVPTVLALLGLPVADDLAGRVLSEAFGGRLDALAARRVDSYEDLWRKPATGRDRDPQMIEAEIERLRSMGYL